MSRLRIALYLDENVDVLLAELLRSRGFEATTTAGPARDILRRLLAILDRPTADEVEDQLIYA